MLQNPSRGKVQVLNLVHCARFVTGCSGSCCGSTTMRATGRSSAATVAARRPHLGLPGVHHHDEGNNAETGSPPHMHWAIRVSQGLHHSMQSTLQAEGGAGPLCPCQLLPSMCFGVACAHALCTCHALMSARCRIGRCVRSTPQVDSCMPAIIVVKCRGPASLPQCVKPSFTAQYLAAGTCGTCLGCVPQAVSTDALPAAFMQRRSSCPSPPQRQACGSPAASSSPTLAGTLLCRIRSVARTQGLGKVWARSSPVACERSIRLPRKQRLQPA